MRHFSSCTSMHEGFNARADVCLSLCYRWRQPSRRTDPAPGQQAWTGRVELPATGIGCVNRRANETIKRQITQEVDLDC